MGKNNNEEEKYTDESKSYMHGGGVMNCSLIPSCFPEI